MKFSTYLSLMSLGASAAVARPLFRDNLMAERRHVPAPVARRQEAAVASATEATAAPVASEAAATQAPFSYTTLTNTGAFSFSGSTYSLSSSVSSTATTETQLPQGTASAEASGNGNDARNMNENSFNSNFNSNFDFNSNFNNGFNGLDFGNQAVITIREVQTVTQFVAVEVPVFLGVQVNNGFRQNEFVSGFSSNFQSRFNQWDINVINQLGFLLAQQYDFLGRASNNGFQSFNNDNFDLFLNKFNTQFSAFDNFNLSDVQQLIAVLQTLNVNQLGSFFGRSDLLFSQDIFDQFGINSSNFGGFVGQLPQILIAIESGAFNNDGIFSNLSNLNLNSLNFLQIV